MNIRISFSGGFDPKFEHESVRHKEDSGRGHAGRGAVPRQRHTHEDRHRTGSWIPVRDAAEASL